MELIPIKYEQELTLLKYVINILNITLPALLLEEPDEEEGGGAQPQEDGGEERDLPRGEELVHGGAAVRQEAHGESFF